MSAGTIWWMDASRTRSSRTVLDERKFNHLSQNQNPLLTSLFRSCTKSSSPNHLTPPRFSTLWICWTLNLNFFQSWPSWDLIHDLFQRKRTRRPKGRDVLTNLERTFDGVGIQDAQERSKDFRILHMNRSTGSDNRMQGIKCHQSNGHFCAMEKKGGLGYDRIKKRKHMIAFTETDILFSTTFIYIMNVTSTCRTISAVQGVSLACQV